MNQKNEERESIYTQDCELYRHNDNLKWSRFQTLSVIEGAVLFALYEYKDKLTPYEQRFLMVFGFLLVAVLCVLALKDQYDEEQHLDRLGKYEKESGNPYIKKPTWLPTGKTLMNIGIGIVLIFNAFELFIRW